MRDCSGFDLLLSVIAVQKICATSQLISCKTKTNHDLIGRVSAFWAICFFFTTIMFFILSSHWLFSFFFLLLFCHRDYFGFGFTTSNQ